MEGLRQQLEAITQSLSDKAKEADQKDQLILEYQERRAEQEKEVELNKANAEKEHQAQLDLYANREELLNNKFKWIGEEEERLRQEQEKLSEAQMKNMSHSADDTNKDLAEVLSSKKEQEDQNEVLRQ
jgi:hypothetical protein